MNNNNRPTAIIRTADGRIFFVAPIPDDVPVSICELCGDEIVSHTIALQGRTPQRMCTACWSDIEVQEDVYYLP